jgi:hypothetical protein
MSTVTTIEVVDLLTIRECIEILVDRRTGRDRTPTLPPAVVDYLGATHVRPRAWTDEAKDLLRQALISGEVGLYASRKIRDGTNAVSDARSGQLTGYQNVAPHERNLPYLRQIKAADRMKRVLTASAAGFSAASSTMRRRRQVRLERSRPIAVNAPFNSLAYVADHNPPHRHLQATGLQVPTLATVLAGGSGFSRTVTWAVFEIGSLRNCIHFCEPVGQNLLCQKSGGDPDRSS